MFFLALTGALTLTAADSSALEATCKKLEEAKSYSFQLEQTGPGGGASAQNRGMEGKYIADKPCLLKRGDQMFYCHGSDIVLQTQRGKGPWKKLNLEKDFEDTAKSEGAPSRGRPERPGREREAPRGRDGKRAEGGGGDRRGGAGGGGGFDPAQFRKTLKRIVMTPFPHRLLEVIAKAGSEVDRKDSGGTTTLSGDLPSEVATEALGLEKSEGGPKLEGSFVAVSKDGVLQSLELTIKPKPREDGKQQRDGGERKLTYTISEVGSTTFDVPVEAERLFEG